MILAGRGGYDLPHARLLLPVPGTIFQTEHHGCGIDSIQRIIRNLGLHSLLHFSGGQGSREVREQLRVGESGRGVLFRRLRLSFVEVQGRIEGGTRVERGAREGLQKVGFVLRVDGPEGAFA